ncbi:hypothetical protein LTR97_001225 [Elasticomyces elasticus]|uniref:F-box domain-containing protein n=1 Tax=Elasticomyces elasticus TaxID=574655 RepID=A0AAN7ZQB8_9PEZI|nr:hypothetical protein LTR97_001225 [Elasticomyces elasticus]
MPTISTRLVWAIRIFPTDLVAAIEVEAQFRAITDTLRLSKIFGGTAPIATLPTELVNHIEDYLTAEKITARAQRRAHVERLYECMDNSCTPWDSHLTDEHKMILINEYLETQDEPTVNSFETWGAQIAQEYIQGHGEDEYCVFWQEDHLKNSLEWHALVGKPGQEGDGLFTKHHDFILAEYGLEVFVAYRLVDQCVYKTRTYLVLLGGAGGQPDGTEKRIFRDGCCWKPPCRLGSKFCQVVDDVTDQVVVPPEPTEAEKGRFARMQRLLGLPVCTALELEVPTLTMLTRVDLGETLGETHKKSMRFRDRGRVEDEED